MTIYPRLGPISLEPHRPENIDLLYAWENDDELLAMSSDRLEHPAIDEVQRSLENWIAGSEDAIVFGIHIDRRLIGYVQIAGIDRDNRRCKMGIVIGDKSEWGRGYGTTAFRLGVRYAFETYDLNRIGAEAYANNPRSIRMLERIGFRREGVLRSAVRRGDHFVDEIVFGLLRAEWHEMGP